MCQFYSKNKDHRRWQCPSRLNVVYSNHVSFRRSQPCPLMSPHQCLCIQALTLGRRRKNAVWHLQLLTWDQVCVRAAPRGSLRSPNIIFCTLFDLSCLISRRCCCPSRTHGSGCVTPPAHFYWWRETAHPPKHLSRAACQQAAAAPGWLAFYIAPCGGFQKKNILF